MIHSYSSIYGFGHAALAELFFDDVTVEEKIDGSQFSFGRINGILHCRSKGQQINIDAPDNLFIQAVETAKHLYPKLTEGMIFRCEYLKKPKHNTLEYSRVPSNHLIVFDIDLGDQSYIDYNNKMRIASELGLDVVPCFYQGRIDNSEMLKQFMDRESILGGQKIEGFVVKNYSRFGKDKKVLMAKHVSESFKEKHSANWKHENPSKGDIIKMLCEQYKTEARWKKAVQHMAEDGKLTFTPQDLGMLIKEVASDIKVDSEDEIKEILFQWAWKDLQRLVIFGFPEWYKNYLLEKHFEDNANGR